MITISIVNHGHENFLSSLLDDLVHFPEISKVILTNNIPLNKRIDISSEIEPKTVVINNEKIKGFAANHNYAFNICTSEYFCVLNPDVRIYENPFPNMLTQFSNKDVALVGPAIPDAGQRDVVGDSGRKS